MVPARQDDNTVTVSENGVRDLVRLEPSLGAARRKQECAAGDKDNIRQGKP
jgi:hypothetical protein